MKASIDFAKVFILDKLSTTFFERPTEIVAQELIGKTLVISGQAGIITETEAYKGAEDPASHAYKGLTPRSAIMYGPCGHLYIYLIYGMYHCMNIVTHEPEKPGAVLIRGLELNQIMLDGPGKICKYFQIDKQWNHCNISESDTIYILNQSQHSSILATPRIGIKKATDKLWRFIRI